MTTKPIVFSVLAPSSHGLGIYDHLTIKEFRKVTSSSLSRVMGPLQLMTTKPIVLSVLATSSHVLGIYDHLTIKEFRKVISSSLSYFWFICVTRQTLN